MNFIQKWIHNYRWHNCTDKVFQAIVMEFVRNGYKVDIPYEGFKHSRLDLRVRYKKKTTYFQFMNGGLLGVGTVSYLCNFVDSTKETLFLVVAEDIDVFSRNALDKKIKIMVAPTPEELFKAVRNNTCVGCIEN